MFLEFVQKFLGSQGVAGGSLWGANVALRAF